jgi:hypothetical protein
MGKYLDFFKKGVKKIDNKIRDLSAQEDNFPEDNIQEDNSNNKTKKGFQEDNNYDGLYDNYDEVGIQQSQKSESFHHYILENKYQDLERSIRGFKDVMDKETQQWKIIRKEKHCFTDEESEGIVRLAQSLLSSDIKLSNMSLEVFSKMMELMYEQLENYFYRIAEYRYGRYGSYENQGKMKDENKKILIELYNRIWANYSRAIGGKENNLTHESVKGQESLQNIEDSDSRNRRRRYT